MLETRSVYCIATENIQLQLPCSTFTGIRSDLEWSIAAISGLALLSSHCTVLTQIKSSYPALWVMNYCPPCIPYRTDETLLTSHQPIAISMVNSPKISIPSSHQFKTSYLGLAMPCSRCQISPIPFVSHW